MPDNVVLSPSLATTVQHQQLDAGILTTVGAQKPGIDLTKVAVLYSHGYLVDQNLLGNPALLQLSGQVSTQLNNAKALMNKLGVKDITQAAPIVISGSVNVSQGLYHPEAGFLTNSVLPVNSSVIIASTLDLTNTTLVIEPSVQSLTIIVETLTSATGARIAYGDTSVWNPTSLPQTTAQAGNSYNPANQVSGQTNGPAGGGGTNGQTGSPQTILPPAAPNVIIYALNITGMPDIELQGLKGAPGNPGQNGGAGGSGAKGVNGTDVAAFGVGVCVQSPGNGGNGGNGGHGGNGGNGGEGGNGGSFSILTTQANWNALIAASSPWTIVNAGGPGGNPGLPGSGGSGGAGGNGGNSSPGGACNGGHNGNNGQPAAQGSAGVEGQSGAQGQAGTITPAVITQEEWEEELTLPWLETINPSQGFAGAAVTGSGLNFGPGDAVLVNGQNVTATFPATGQFQVTLPSDLAGGPNSIAVRRASDGQVSTAMTYTVLPFLSGSTAAGGYSPGDTITLNGTGFLTNASVHLTQPSQAIQVLVPTSVTATSIVFNVPAATGAASAAQGTATITVMNPDGLQSNTLQITRLSFVTNGFLPSVNGFAFTNASACPGAPTLDTFAQDFGSVEVAFSFFTDPVLTAAYYALYAVLLGPECNGLCTGFTCAAMDRYTSGVTNVFAAFPACTPALKTEFSVGWGRQMSGELLISFFDQCLKAQSQVIETVQEIEQAFSGTPTRGSMPLLFFIPSGMPTSSGWFNALLAGHSLVPYKLVRPLGWTSGYNGVKLYIYDCNAPGSNDCAIELTQSGSTVSFSYDGNGIYTTPYSSANDFTIGVQDMQQALYDSVDLPWFTGAGWIVDHLLSQAALTVSNLAGQETGRSGNSLLAQVPGVVPSLLSLDHNLMMIPTQMALQRNIQGTSTGSYTYVSIAPPNAAIPASAYSSLLPPGATAVVPRERGFSLQNVACTAATKDTILVGPDNQSIQLSTSDGGKSFKVLIAHHYDVQTGTGSTATLAPKMQLIQLSDLMLDAGEEVLLWTDTAIGQVGLSNPGNTKSFTATLSIVDSTTGKTTASQEVAGTVNQNADYLMTISSWSLSSAPSSEAGALRSLLPAGFQMPTVK
jgi:hypothetical protein